MITVLSWPGETYIGNPLSVSVACSRDYHQAEYTATEAKSLSHSLFGEEPSLQVSPDQG